MFRRLRRVGARVQEADVLTGMDSPGRIKRILQAVVWLAVSMSACGSAHAAPDEIAQGKELGYPTRRANWDRAPYRVGNYSRLATLFPHNTVAPPERGRPLTQDSGALSHNLQARIATHLEQFPVTGFLVLHDGRILAEHYQYERNAADTFHGWSMSKSVLNLLVGAAVEDGLIASADDAAAKYLPELAGTLHGETKIKHLLQMSTGAAVLHKPGAEGGDLGEIYGELLSPRSDSLALVKRWNRRMEEAGTRFNYNELAPITLMHLVRKVSGRSLAAYLEQKIWKPMGAESGATWITDSTGAEFGCVGFSATLRDWGRLGMLLAEDGRYAGKQIVARNWLLRSTTVAPEDPHLLPKAATPSSGYGYLTWIDGYRQRRVFSFRGHHNQFVIVAPDLKLVLVQTAVSEDLDRFPKSLYGIYTALMSELEQKSR
jgi:CubicO group peptidase (beta-lactamase class C family)